MKERHSFTPGPGEMHKWCVQCGERESFSLHLGMPRPHAFLERAGDWSTCHICLKPKGDPVHAHEQYGREDGPRRDGLDDAQVERIAIVALHRPPPTLTQLLFDANLGNAEKHVELAISVTPTGPRREALTEANIHLKLAIEALKKAKELP